MATETGTETSTTEGNGTPQATAETLEVRNPADGSVTETVTVDGPARVRDVVARVRAAQPEWEALGPRGRYRWLGRWRDWMIDNQDRIVDVMQSETGKVRADASLEPPIVCNFINYYGENAERLLADEESTPHFPLLRTKRLKIVYRPFPVVGVIGPWNYPLILSVGDAVPALAAGCAVVIKPSEFTPLSAMEMVRAWREDVGGPDVLGVVNGIGETGQALVDEVDFVQFTGSERTGKRVMARAAETLTPVSLELGGKDPLIVLSDADVRRAAKAAAFGAMMNSGQTCLSVERVYVEDPVYDEFMRRLTEEVRKLRQGADGRSFGSDVGAMVSPNQTEIVERHVADALERGASALTGGGRREGPGDYYEPTILTGVDHSMAVMREETFGPVAAVMRVRDEEEAIRLANDTRYGLAATVFSRDPKRAERVARRLEVGTVNLNDVLINYAIPEVPMGGWKSSGIGYRNGPDGIRKYCRRESLVISRLARSAGEPTWFPYTPRKRRAIRAATRFFNARDWRRRLGRR
jgi:acyl-CoA reductase-like NAD-dependent aldehyde dehydrogenase